MRSRHLHHLWRLLLGSVLVLACVPAWADPLAVLGILQGSAVLVRQTSRFTLAEGAALLEGDIVETAAGSFAQVEFDDGTLVGVGEASRLILKPRLTGLKTAGRPRLYLLEGWIKARLAPAPGAAFDLLAPEIEVDAKAGAVVLRVQPRAYALFVESGSAQLVQREGARATLPLKGGDFAAQAAGADKPSVSTRMAPDFLQQLPRPFRDPLPPRAALFAKRVITLKPLGPIAYADVTAWMHSESGVRLALSRQWRSRASDRAFRADVAANLGAHMEWERVIFPERFLPKKASEPGHSTR